MKISESNRQVMEIQDVTLRSKGQPMYRPQWLESRVAT